MAAAVLLGTAYLVGHLLDPLTPLAEAARAGDVDEIDRLAAGGADLDEPSGAREWPPLLHAIHAAHAGAAARLIEHGAAIEGRIGQQALTIAASHGFVDSVLLLLRRGVRPSKRGTTPVQLMSGAVAGAYDRDYEWSGCERHTTVVRALIGYDADLKRATPHTARRFAARQGCDELVALLK
jgi:hypothetical protein